MGLLNRDRSRHSARQRGQLRRRLREVDDQRRDLLRDLGGLSLEMYRQDRLERQLLWSKAAEIAALDDEANLLRRGLEEGLTVGELEALGDGQSKLDPSSPQPQ